MTPEERAYLRAEISRVQIERAKRHVRAEQQIARLAGLPTPTINGGRDRVRGPRSR